MAIPKDYAPQFARIDALKQQLDRKRPLTEGEMQRLQKEFLVEFTCNSNAIEGNALTLQETALALEGIAVDKKPLKDHMEAVGHRDAFSYVEDLVRRKEPFSEAAIKTIHSLLLMDRPKDKGVYRRIPVRIMEAAHVPPQPCLVPIEMEQLMAEFAKTRRHPIENAALFHLKFEDVHPFVDGNGRTGRLILNFSLMQNGYPPIDVKFEDRRRYYACFERFFQNDDSRPMVEMIARYVEKRLSYYLSLLAD